MSSRSPLAPLVAAAALALALPSVAVAQTRPNRVNGPFAGLFGGGRSDNQQTLDLRLSLFGVHQRVDASEVDPTLLDPRFQQDSTFGGGQAGLFYGFNRRADTSSFNASASAYAADFSVQPKSPQYGSTGGVSLATKLTDRINFQAAAQAGYASTLSFGVSAGEGPIQNVVNSLNAPTFDPNGLTSTVGSPALDLENYTVLGNSTLSWDVSRRGSLIVDAQGQRSFFIGNETSDQALVSSGLTYSHRAWRRLSLYATYRRSQTLALGEGQRSISSQSVDFGANYGDGLTLQLTRTTTLSMNVGLGSGRGLNGGTRFTALGGATLTHTMARSWSTSLNVSRNLGYVAGFEGQAVLQDSASATVGGQLTRRATFSATGFYYRGYLGLDTSTHFDSYGASSGVSVALHRRISAFAQVGYYGNRIPAGSSSLPFAPSFDRAVAVAGVSLWSPLYTNPRMRR